MAATENKWKTGDLVMLKSTGPTMTVSNPQQTAPWFSTSCVWFDGPTVCRDEFNAETLVPAPNPGSGDTAP